MWNRTALLLLVLLISAWALAAVAGYERQSRWEEEEGEEEEAEAEEEEEEEEEEESEEPYGGGGSGGSFLLEKPRVVVKTEAGVVRVVKGRGWPSTMHVGFIDMEPNTLFLPQYMDAHLILFIKMGAVKVGAILNDELVERNLTMGDIFRIPAGSAFYMANSGKGQRLQIICSIDTSESKSSLRSMPFQSFFIGGGLYPTSVLSGFDTYTLTTALNVTKDELSTLMGKQTGGPIIYMSNNIQGSIAGGGDIKKPKKLESVMRMKQRQIRQMKPSVADDDDEDEEGKVPMNGESNKKDTKKWTWRKLLNAIFRIEDEEVVEGGNKASGPVNFLDSYNIYGKTPDFRNKYGWSVAVDQHDYKLLKKSGVGIYLVNLTAGSMLAPHVNPTATEYGVVMGGSGTLQVVFPNGSLATNVEVYEGDVFWIPRYFPFCQVAARNGPLEFFGFTTSAGRNRPQFLVGASSILRSMSGPEMAAAFGTSEERLTELVAAQKESIILPSWRSTHAVAEEEEEGPGEEKEPILIKKAAEGA